MPSFSRYLKKLGAVAGRLEGLGQASGGLRLGCWSGHYLVWDRFAWLLAGAVAESWTDAQGGYNHLLMYS